VNQETCRILLIDSSPERFSALSSVLKEAGYRDIVTCDPSTVTVNCVAELNPHIVLIDVECPSRDTMEQLVLIRDHCPKPVVLLSQDESVQDIEAAIQSGVSAYLTEGINPSQARPVIEAAMATFAAFQSLRRELTETQNQLENRKLIARAKGILMEKEEISEDVAYHRMRKFAMDQKCTLVDVARRIIEATS
jgi:two-component system, response regulator / RNA-binding antiterminator